MKIRVKTAVRQNDLRAGISIYRPTRKLKICIKLDNVILLAIFLKPMPTFISTYLEGTAIMDVFSKKRLSTPMANTRNGMTSRLIRLAFMLRNPQTQYPKNTDIIMKNILKRDKRMFDFTMLLMFPIDKIMYTSIRA